jgi:hypothetical protein
LVDSRNSLDFRSNETLWFQEESFKKIFMKKHENIHLFINLLFLFIYYILIDFYKIKIKLNKKFKLN